MGFCLFQVQTCHRPSFKNVVATIPIIPYDLSVNKVRVLKLGDVERELGVSRWTLYEWLRSGKLHGFKLPCGHYRIPIEQVNSLKEELNWLSTKEAKRRRRD